MERRSRGDHAVERRASSAREPATALGKRTLTATLDPSSPSSAAQGTFAAPSHQWLAPTAFVGEAAASEHGLVQFDATAPPAGDVHALADRGAQGAGAPLPHLDTIQRAFGAHEVSGIRTHRDAAATDATRALNARGYAMGDNVVLAADADLRTVAHEAAHVVQQRGGLQLSGGVGQVGDAHERHADQVADRVARGESAEALLDRYEPNRGSAPPLQRQALQLEHRAAETSPEAVGIVQQVASGDNFAAMRTLLRGIQQAARRRRPGMPDHVVCVGGGDSFDLHLTAEDSREAQNMLMSRMAQLEERAEDSAVERGRAPQSRPDDDVPMSGGSPFAARFNREFADILPALREAGRTASGTGEEERSEQLTMDELNLMFSPRQRTLLTQYFSDHMIPDRLFNGDDSGGANAQQRIVISGHMLARGRYREGSFAQELHARYCGHYNRLVETYAGVVADRGAGVDNQFDHSGEQVLAGGRARTEFQGERQAVGPGHRGEESRRVFRRTGLPIEEFGRIQTGDRLFVFTDTNTQGGDHSVIFSHWVDSDTRTVDGVSFRRAVIFHQPNPEAGAQQSTWRLGDDFTSVNGAQVYPVTRIARHGAGDRPPETADDLIEHELGLPPANPEQRREELMPELGSGPAADANFRTIMQMERRHHGRLNIAWLRQWLREQNAAVIAQLERIGEQRRLFDEANQSDDLETLIRLNERLRNRDHNADALEVEEAEERAEIEPRHAEVEAENAAREREIQLQISQLNGEIARASEVLDIDTRIRGLTHERRRRENLLRGLESRIPRVRNGERRKRLEAQRQGHLERIRELSTALAELEGPRDRAAAGEERDRQTRLRSGINMRQRVAQLTRRRDRALDELEALDASAGYYTAHPGSRDLLIGRRRDEHGERTRERVTGRLSALDPAPPWAELVIEGQPGAAQEAQQQRRDAAPARRHERRQPRRR